MDQKRQDFYEFGPFVLDTMQHLLLREQQPVPLTPKTYDTLLVLLENSGKNFHPHLWSLRQTCFFYIRQSWRSAESTRPGKFRAGRLQLHSLWMAASGGYRFI